MFGRVRIFPVQLTQLLSRRGSIYCTALFFLPLVFFLLCLFTSTFIISTLKSAALMHSLKTFSLPSHTHFLLFYTREMATTTIAISQYKIKMLISSFSVTPIFHFRTLKNIHIHLQNFHFLPKINDFNYYIEKLWKFVRIYIILFQNDIFVLREKIVTKKYSKYHKKNNILEKNF